MVEWQIFNFLKDQNSKIFSYCKCHCFLGFYATFFVFCFVLFCFFRNEISESAKISKIGLPTVHWQMNYRDFVKFSEQQQVLDSLWWSWTALFFHDFLCFPFWTKFPWFLCVFHTTENLPLYTMVSTKQTNGHTENPAPWNTDFFTRITGTVKPFFVDLKKRNKQTNRQTKHKTSK